MLFTRLIASKATTDAMGPPQISNARHETEVAGALAPGHRFSAHPSMTIKMCTNVWL